MFQVHATSRRRRRVPRVETLVVALLATILGAGVFTFIAGFPG